ncbi:MAG: chromosome segregation protein SMC, partial [Bacteroidota bacterium]
MRLKQLYIKGFKSFANETVVNFQEDVIGIVGPNGSGKSNIVDAIRWVLGEQKSKELRLDTMSSVIFNGTKKRRPGGMAQVSLTFENTKNLLPTDYQSVQITRILYRSGESEYQLNGVPCRLKDITSLFLDTGIGSNSYAIIALGMVDDLLTDKENSRRKMFEQAAGISKYKVRKRETINKLNSTTADLDRVEDLLFEIEGNLAALEKQAKRTRKYFQLKEEYKVSSISLAHFRIGTYKEQFKRLKSQQETEEDAYRKDGIAITQYEAQLEAEKKKNLDKEKALSDRQRELNSTIGKLRGMENDKKMRTQKLQFIDQDREKILNDIDKAKTKIEALTSEIDFYRSELNGDKRLEVELEEQLNATESKLQQIKEKHKLIKMDMDSILQEQQKLERALFEIEKEKAVKNNQIQSYRQELQRNDDDVERRRKEVAHIKEQFDQLVDQEAQKNKELADLQQTEENRVQEIEKEELKLDKNRKQLAKLNRKLDASYNEQKLIRSMVENLEGFPESIRFLSSRQEWSNNAQLLSDVIYVNEAYRVAIENYLEPYLNYYIVDNLESAYKAIELLGQAQQGKANFFILEAFNEYEPPILMNSGFFNAIDLVETDPPYRKLVHYLLENVVVTNTDDLKSGLPENDLVVLSQSGRVIKRKHSLSGGSVGLFEGKKIGRKKSLSILADQIKELEENKSNFKRQEAETVSKIKALQAKSYTKGIRNIQKELNQITQSRITFHARLESFESFMKSMNSKKEEIQQIINEITVEERALNRSLDDQHELLEQIKSRNTNMDGSFKEIAEELSTASSNYNDKNIEFIRQQNKVTTLQRELSFREKQLEENQ